MKRARTTPGKVATAKPPPLSNTSATRNHQRGRSLWLSDRVAAVSKKAAFAGLVLAVLLALESFLKKQAKKPAAGPGQGTDQGPKYFSQQWLKTFKRGVPGCLNPPMDTYSWRTAGWGSNINTLLLQWAEGLVSGRTDLAVIFDGDWPWFEQTTCRAASGGVETTGGWHCLFQRIPHLCVYNNQQEWKGALTPLTVSSAEKRQAQRRMGDVYARRHRRSLRRALLGMGISDMGALAMLLDYVYSHFQPWFEDDISAILDEPSIATLRRGKYVGVHIRRTDKIIAEANRTETVEYFKAAAEYLNKTVHTPAVADISGVWLSSDDKSVLAEVQEIAPQYFPEVDPNKILFISDRVTLENNTSSDWKVLLKGAQSRNGYDAMVLLMAELRMLARADVFSGTFSSNVGRMVALMRKSLDKPKRSAVAADKKRWRSG